MERARGLCLSYVQSNTEQHLSNNRKALEDTMHNLSHLANHLVTVHVRCLGHNAGRPNIDDHETAYQSRSPF